MRRSPRHDLLFKIVLLGGAVIHSTTSTESRWAAKRLSDQDPRKMKSVSILSKIFSCVFAFLLFIVLFSIGCVALVWIASKNPNSLFASLPSDEQLFQNYIQKQNEFNQLAQMLISEKRLLVIFPESQNCQIANQKLVSSIEDPQCLQYVHMFKDLGLDFSYSGEEPLWLNVAFSGLSVSGSIKGYYYSSQGPPAYGKIVEAADTDDVSGQSIFKPIEGYWYIFLSH